MATRYGTQEEVATMASIWTEDGEWSGDTNPKVDEVENWLDQVSAQFNVALGSHFFVPESVTLANTPNVFISISQQVVNLVSDLCNWKNSSGRYFTEKLIERGITPQMAILKDINAWIELNADGLVADGVQQIAQPSIRKRPLFRVLS
jgi:hypothetical protein